MQMDAQAQTDQAALEREITKIREQGKIDAELLVLEGKIRTQEQAIKQQGEYLKTSITERNKKVISKQKSNDDIIKQAVRNVPEKEIAAAKAADVRVKAEKVKVDLIEAQKPESAKSK
jgi:predicted acyltransferase (DUF342 family)